MVGLLEECRDYVARFCSIVSSSEFIREYKDLDNDITQALSKYTPGAPQYQMLQCMRNIMAELMSTNIVLRQKENGHQLLSDKEFKRHYFAYHGDPNDGVRDQME